MQVVSYFYLIFFSVMSLSVEEIELMFEVKTKNGLPLIPRTKFPVCPQLAIRKVVPNRKNWTQSWGISSPFFSHFFSIFKSKKAINKRREISKSFYAWCLNAGAEFNPFFSFIIFRQQMMSPPKQVMKNA